ncbi:hypothetical protein [Paenibacillus sp. UMB4589-SE434]|uniref:hypothetical protein n=1 Tax=Paenibacillus sp. UMB4589-SE434 TaxID=3046314 RepID=UPI00254DAA37|nr:hypothetical protein [Paenibacillus sp. UMB4589-SE434]MDK8183429.1 hypothetical protein [Paenibacillus sp. UMB4589-SE434]
MAHDLRTPLEIVQGHTEGVLDGGIQHADRPEFQLLIRNINVSQYMGEKCAEYRQLCEQHNVQFEGEISIDPDRLIALDPDRIS